VTGPSKVVINADDFGISTQVSAEIARCFRAGVVSSTTVMANMPGFDDAIALARSEGFADRIGVHLNLTCGQPLTEGIRRWTGANGEMTVLEHRLWADRSLLTAVYQELKAQVERLIHTGITPTHFDSHQHILNSFPYTAAALQVARECNVSRMRIARNAFYDRSAAKTTFKLAYNAYLGRQGMRRVHWFTDVKPYYSHVQAGGRPLKGTTELMCHPGMRLAHPVSEMTTETEILLHKDFRELLSQIQPVPYTAL